MVTLAKPFYFSKGVHIMKIDLVKIKFGKKYSYKYRPYKTCCESFENNPCIVFTCDDIIGGSPNDEPRFCMQDIEVDGTDFTFYDNYPISFCPHCGKPIEIEVTETIDFSEGYDALAKKVRDAVKILGTTDSIKEYDKSLVQKRDLDKKISAISELCEYCEEDFKE